MDRKSLASILTRGGYGVTLAAALLGITDQIQTLAAAILAITAATTALVGGELQKRENALLTGRLEGLECENETLKRRTKVEEGTSAAIMAQGELATKNYDWIVQQLRSDGHID